MAFSSTLATHFFLICSLLFISSSTAKTSTRPKGLILPVSKDLSTLQYITEIKQRTPLVPVKLAVDLGAQFLWVDCEKDYTTSSYRPALCDSAICSFAKSTSCMTECYSPARPGCTNNTCTLIPENTYAPIATSGAVGCDALAVQSASGRPVTIPHFLFVCGATLLLDKLSSGVTGMAGLGRTKMSMPSQLFAAFSLKRKLGVCLSSTSSNGNIFFGEFDSSTAPLTYTPLLTNPVSTAGVYSEGDASSEYFIGVESIKINEKVVRINPTLLSINGTTGHGGTKISTVDKYTVLETSIYKAVLKAFAKELNVPRVPSVAPFGACFSAKKIGTAYTGPAVPTIDLVLQSKDVYWRIYGGNSMVQVNKDVLCLGFVDGGLNSRTSIVIGGHQVEENLLEIDIAASKLGFSPLLYRKQICANFRFAARA
ncbi:Xyloglucan-specific fungal endoglucanase inhibitor protein [Heracleum sosnowskyi]|uniref:Xyloglucan-specific fungal endoglucanase inhibitor protein n=1 Tax=Heracleum sosnowskyi TaxID=360622 RepID=A0AAD8I6U0_9APIA|nr:Xyloglucan-specific fungal endoglucanase inhibitor protein [Heracleum sosnowskyi]